MGPVFELNKMNVLRMVSMLSRNHKGTRISPVVLKDSFGESEKEIKKIMDELVSCGLFTKENLDLEKEFGTNFVNHFGKTAYKLASKDFFVMKETEILKEGIELEEKHNLDVSEILYNILLERNEKDYHTLFCLARLKRKRGCFDSRLINLAIEEARKQRASEDVLQLINEELKLILSMLQNKADNLEKPKLKFEEEGYNFEIIYTENKTSSAKLKGNTIILKISKSMPEEIQIKVIDSLRRRIINKIKKGVIADTEKEELKNFNDGDKIKVDDQEYALKIFFEDKKSSSARLDGSTIRMHISANLSEDEKKEHINDLIRMVISKHRLPKLKQIIEELNKEHFNVKINDIKFKKQLSRWGSCSENGNINISYRLLFAPDDILKYVCVHELAHLIEPNHSERFWRIVKKVTFDYKEKVEWLKKHGGKLGLW